MRRLLKERPVMPRGFPRLKVQYFEDIQPDGTAMYTSEVEISAGDRIVIDGRSTEELEAKIDSTLKIALFCRQPSAI